jgi:hypothetical protein
MMNNKIYSVVISYQENRNSFKKLSNVILSDF